MTPPTPTPATIIPGKPATMNALAASRIARTTAITTATAVRPAYMTTNKIHLLMKVAHAVFKDTDPIATFRPFSDIWKCSIIANEQFTTEELMRYLVNNSRSVNTTLTYWSEAVEPVGDGDWVLMIGHIINAKGGARSLVP